MTKPKGEKSRRARRAADDRVMKIAMGAMGAGLIVGAIIAPAKPGHPGPRPAAHSVKR